MSNLRCSDCKYKEDFTPSGCEKCNTCEWGLGVSDLHTNFEPIERIVNYKRNPFSSQLGSKSWNFRKYQN